MYSIKDITETMVDTAEKAGKAIMEIYNSSTIEYSIKDDSSPLTQADLAAQKIISDELQNSYPEIPHLSEEEAAAPYSERSSWERLFVIDPLDGTKSFIKKDGSFTVNIALVEKGIPIAGVVYAPARDWLYYTDSDVAMKKESGSVHKIKPFSGIRESGWIAVASKNHQSEMERLFLDSWGISELTSIGSSLKFCLVAEGKADVYPRSGPTMEWDTAAAHAIIRSIGGSVIVTGPSSENSSKEIEPGEDLRYNRKNLLNPSFLCLAGSFQDIWKKKLENAKL